MRTTDPLHGIAAFLAIADRLSFTAAAESLGLTRATIGAQLRELERRLGVRLVQRSTRHVALTVAGAAYREALAGLLQQVGAAERAAAFFQTEAAGRLKVSAPPDLAQRHMIAMIAAFMKAHPGIAVDLDLSHGAVNLVEQGFDLAIRGTLSVEPNLITRQIGSSPIHITAAPAYLAEHGAPATPDELAGHACLHFAMLRWGRAWLMSRDGVETRVALTPRLMINDGESLRRAALEGVGIALLPAFLVGEDVRAGRLVPVLTDWTVPSIPLHAVYPANRNIAAKVRLFVGFLADRFAAHPDLGAPPEPG